MVSSSEDDVINAAADVEDDLFGDEDDEPTEKTRELSDRELDSGDDEDRDDRAGKGDAGEIDFETGRDARVLEATVWRHPLPKPFDGEVSSTNILFLPTRSARLLTLPVQFLANAKVSWYRTSCLRS